MKNGDKVFITAFTKVYRGEVVIKDQSKDSQDNERYIVRLADTSEVLSVRADMLTPQPKGKSK